MRLTFTFSLKKDIESVTDTVVINESGNTERWAGGHWPYLQGAMKVVDIMANVGAPARWR